MANNRNIRCWQRVYGKGPRSEYLLEDLQRDIGGASTADPEAIADHVEELTRMQELKRRQSMVFKDLIEKSLTYELGGKPHPGWGVRAMVTADRSGLATYTNFEAQGNAMVSLLRNRIHDMLEAARSYQLKKFGKELDDAFWADFTKALFPDERHEVKNPAAIEAAHSYEAMMAFALDRLNRSGGYNGKEIPFLSNYGWPQVHNSGLVGGVPFERWWKDMLEFDMSMNNFRENLQLYRHNKTKPRGGKYSGQVAKTENAGPVKTYSTMDGDQVYPRVELPTEEEAIKVARHIHKNIASRGLDTLNLDKLAEEMGVTFRFSSQVIQQRLFNFTTSAGRLKYQEKYSGQSVYDSIATYIERTGFKIAAQEMFGYQPNQMVQALWDWARVWHSQNRKEDTGAFAKGPGLIAAKAWTRWKNRGVEPVDEEGVPQHFDMTHGARTAALESFFNLGERQIMAEMERLNPTKFNEGSTRLGQVMTGLRNLQVATLIPINVPIMSLTDIASMFATGRWNEWQITNPLRHMTQMPLWKKAGWAALEKINYTPQLRVLAQMATPGIKVPWKPDSEWGYKARRKLASRLGIEVESLLNNVARSTRMDADFTYGVTQRATSQALRKSGLPGWTNVIMREFDIENIGRITDFSDPETGLSWEQMGEWYPDLQNHFKSYGLTGYDWKLLREAPRFTVKSGIFEAEYIDLENWARHGHIPEEGVETGSFNPLDREKNKPFGTQAHEGVTKKTRKFYRHRTDGENVYRGRKNKDADLHSGQYVDEEEVVPHETFSEEPVVNPDFERVRNIIAGMTFHESHFKLARIPDARQAEFVTRGQKMGEVPGEFMKEITQFKMFSISWWMTEYGRMMNSNQTWSKKTETAMALIGVGTILTALSLSLREIAEGRNPPDWDDENLWYRSLFDTINPLTLMGVPGPGSVRSKPNLSLVSPNIKSATDAANYLLFDTGPQLFRTIQDEISGEDEHLEDRLRWQYERDETMAETLKRHFSLNWYSKLFMERILYDQFRYWKNPEEYINYVEKDIEREYDPDAAAYFKGYWWEHPL